MYKTTQKLARNLVLILLLLLLVACERTDSLTVTISNDQQEATAERAIAFVEKAEQQLTELGLEAGRMSWVYSNFITADTEILSALADKNFTAKQV